MDEFSYGPFQLKIFRKKNSTFEIYQEILIDGQTFIQPEKCQTVSYAFLFATFFFEFLTSLRIFKRNSLYLNENMGRNITEEEEQLRKF